MAPNPDFPPPIADPEPTKGIRDTSLRLTFWPDYSWLPLIATILGATGLMYLAGTTTVSLQVALGGFYLIALGLSSAFAALLTFAYPTTLTLDALHGFTFDKHCVVIPWEDIVEVELVRWSHWGYIKVVPAEGETLRLPRRHWRQSKFVAQVEELARPRNPLRELVVREEEKRRASEK